MASYTVGKSKNVREAATRVGWTRRMVCRLAICPVKECVWCVRECGEAFFSFCGEASCFRLVQGGPAK